MNKKNKLNYIVVSSMLLVVLLFIIDSIMMVPYNEKALIKIISLTILIGLYIFLCRDNFIKTSLKNISFKKDIKIVLILSVLVIALIVGAFLIALNYNLISVIEIKNDFYYKYKIDKSNLIYYMAYLCFINALIEEIFFRGFLFLNIKNIGSKKFAYIFSSFLFSVYHISNVLGWVNVYIFYTVLFALFIAGLVFNYLDDEMNTFFNSYILHVSADIGICICGAYIFYVL